MKNFLAIDIGGTYTKYGLLKADGQVVIKGSLRTEKSRDRFVDQIVSLIQRHRDQVAGVGLCLPGVVDTREGRVLSCAALPFLETSHFVELLQQSFPSLPMTLENDGNAAALAEKWLGNLMPVTDGAILVLGSGVGAAIFINGQLFQGSHFVAGEPSFMVMNDAYGPVEESTAAGLSAVGMVRTIGTSLGLVDPEDGRAVFSAINAGNEAAVQIFREFCHAVAVLIFNLQSVLDLERVVIGGGISGQPIVAQQIAREFNALKQVTPLAARTLVTPEIMNARLHNDANLIGAIYHLEH
ncbi:ROK family protein [Lactiplantibacillus carotarum]|uniref:ROK family protein n=1 Tax=Lactiplantibacillus carotarum TaxID=2993456 RepID=UPI00298F36F5|nr:ROK family protein [Lactiplantibacillus carotarum]